MGSPNRCVLPLVSIKLQSKSGDCNILCALPGRHLGLALTCSDNGELTLWEFDPPPPDEGHSEGHNQDSRAIGGGGIRRGSCLPVAHFFADGITSCAIGGGREGSLRLVCGLAEGLTCVLARSVSAWATLPSFIGIPKMVPDIWCEGCSCCRAAFTRMRRRHHCRRCGILICSDCSRTGPPSNELEREAVLQEMRRSKLRKIACDVEYDKFDSGRYDDIPSIVVGCCVDVVQLYFIGRAMQMKQQTSSPSRKFLLIRAVPLLLWPHFQRLHQPQLPSCQPRYKLSPAWSLHRHRGR